MLNFIFRNIKTLFFIFLPPILVFILQGILSFGFDVYHTFPSMDIPMHLLGGVVMALSLSKLYEFLESKNITPKAHYLFKIFVVFVSTATVAVIWEFHEFLIDLIWDYGAQVDLKDTMTDLMTGMLSALFTTILIHWRTLKSETIMDKEIYLDNAATTYTDPRVLEAMLPYFTEKYGNSNNMHSQGQASKIAVDASRETIAKYLNCRGSEIYFTGTATEANNLAITGFARANKEKGKHIITSSIEHASVSEPLLKLEENEGFEVTFLPVDSEGFVSPKDLEEAIRPDTILVSIMHANNEIGTIQPIKELGEICKNKGIIFHTDACQTQGCESIDVQDLNVDMMTLNGSKIYGPKGIGALYIKRGIKIEAIIHGGGHEAGLRAGTLNPASIVGMAKALELAQENKEEASKKLSTLRDYLIDRLLSKIPNSRLNGPRKNRIPNNVNIAIQDVNTQLLMINLNEVGICCSSGSACKIGVSHVSNTLSAIGLPKNLLHASIRLTLGKQNTKEEIDYVIDILPILVEKIRNN